MWGHKIVQNCLMSFIEYSQEILIKFSFRRFLVKNLKVFFNTEGIWIHVIIKVKTLTFP